MRFPKLMWLTLATLDLIAAVQVAATSPLKEDGLWCTQAALLLLLSTRQEGCSTLDAATSCRSGKPGVLKPWFMRQYSGGDVTADNVYFEPTERPNEYRIYSESEWSARRP
jgi:hypothetical protein